MTSLRVPFAKLERRAAFARRFQANRVVALATIALAIFGVFSLAESSRAVADDLSSVGFGSANSNSSFLYGDAERAQTTPTGAGILTGLLSGEGTPVSQPTLVARADDPLAPAQDDRLELELPEDEDAPELVVPQYEATKVGRSTLYSQTRPPRLAPTVVSAQRGWKGEDDEFGEVYVLYGDCRVSQEEGVASAPLAVVWLERNAEFPNGMTGARVWAYLQQDGSAPLNVDLKGVCNAAKTNGAYWLGEFDSLSDVDLHIALPGEDQIRPDELYNRALNLLREETAPAAATGNLLAQNSLAPELAPRAPQPEPTYAPDPNADEAPVEPGLGWSVRGDGEIVNVPETSQVEDYWKTVSSEEALSRVRVQLLSRYDRELNIMERSHSSESPDGEQKDVWFVSNGFTLIVQGLAKSDNIPIGDVVELSADQATIWTRGLSPRNLSEQKTIDDLDLEIYLDGNVVFREGDKVAYADRMYYDVRNRVGIIEDAELIADMPEADGAYFRLGAKKITQRGPNALHATDAWISTSAMGRPTYRLQSNSIVAERKNKPLYDSLSGRPLINNETGALLTDDKRYVIAENNFVALGNMPVLYWPWMAMDVRDRSLYLRGLKFGHDHVLGTQVRSTWNPYQLFGMSKSRPEGTDWDLNLDYLSKRGFGHGMTFLYDRDSICQWKTRAIGMLNYYGIYDKGKDNLGRGRRALPFERKYRYRGIWKHRQELGTLDCGLNLFDNCCVRDGWTLTGEFGKSSDRNYIPQYFEEEWLTTSNPETSLELKRTVNNRSLSVFASAHTDKFYTQTSWLPRFDHHWIGQAIGQSPLAWYEHTKIGFAQFRSTDAPYALDDAALFRYLDWELAPDSLGNGAYVGHTLKKDSLIFSTRHELDLPLQVGPIKTTPYALGEYAFYGRTLERKNVSRLYGRLGMRFNLPIWKVDSDVESKTWYLNGLAHKMNLIVDASYSEANKNFDDLVLYNQVDDWQIQDFRRRYSVTTFAGKGAGYSDAIPVRFDERYYAIREGTIGGLVASPSDELADDLALVRVGWNNRWQTKRGPVGARRVVDWITLNIGMNLYPKRSQNFGRVPGMLDYDATWQIGDRFALLSSGLYDFWGTGQKITRIGAQRRRPGLSSCYLGVDWLRGPIDSTYLNFGLTYRTSERWGIGFSNSFDLSEGYNIGQKVSVSRIGESFVFTLGASRNESKDNWGVSLSVEPVFMFDKDKREEGLLGLGNM